MIFFHPLLPRTRRLCLLLAWWNLNRAEALRGTGGCYDDYQMSCQHHMVSLEEIEYTMEELQEICWQIETEIFGSHPRIIQQFNLHPAYLNGKERTDPFCEKMQKAYSHCSFCYKDPNTYSQCVYPYPVNCTNQPTREEIIENQNDIYSVFFKSMEDIDATCDQLKNAREKFGFPYTIDLCERQRLVMHLCPGECDKPSCFDTAPTCDHQEEVQVWAALPFENNETEIESKCASMRTWVLHPLDNVAIFDTSKHWEYLQYIPEDNPDCPAYQHAYPYCFWCKSPDILCFDETRAPTCNPLDNNSTGGDNTSTIIDIDIDIDIDDVCESIFFSLPIFTVDEEQSVIDPSFQAKNLYIFEDTELCQQARQVYHKCIWCDVDAETFAAMEDLCDFNISVPEEYTTQILDYLNFSTTNETGLTREQCDEEIFDYWVYNASFPLTVNALYETVAIFALCPDTFCSESTLPPEPDTPTGYLGTTTEAQRKALIWSSRASAFLSFLGASFVLFDILRDQKARSTVYHQILIGMATFDIVTAIAWSFSTAPIDADVEVVGAMGNEATCKAQAFFIQLGLTSVFYNVSLALYYVLVIAYSWREFQLKKIRLYLHAVPLTIGIGLAFGGLSSYSMLEYGCHLEPYGPPDGELWPILVFVVVPLGISILAITTCMFMVYWNVRKQVMKAKKWNLGTSQAQKMEHAVFWQCVSYVLAFYITWPIMFGVYLFSVDEYGPFALTMTVAFVAPLQGFSNSMVYLRTKLTSKKSGSQVSTEGRPSALLSRLFHKLTKQKVSQTSHFSGPHFDCDGPPQCHEDDNDHDDDILKSGMDPSAALALYRDRISVRDGSNCGGVGKQTRQDLMEAPEGIAAGDSGESQSSNRNNVTGGERLGSINEQGSEVIETDGPL